MFKHTFNSLLVTLFAISTLFAVELSFGDFSTTDNTVDINISGDADVAGFQFNINSSDGLSIIDASGGAAEDAGFTISTNSSTVLAFSLTGGNFSVDGTSHLVTVSYDGSGGMLSLANGVVSDPAGNQLDVTYGDDLDFTTPVEPVVMSFGEVSSSSVELYLSSSTAVAGFQFDVNGVTVTGASGGAAEDAGFTVSTSATTVLGFSLTGATIAPGEYLLTTIGISSSEDSQISLSGAVVSDPNGETLPIEYPDPVDYITEPVYGCTDMSACNYDGSANTDDGSCDYGSECWDGSFACDLSDCPAQPVILSFGNVNTSDATIDIMIDSGDSEVGGFQFDVNTSGADLDVTGASGGAAGDAGFQVSTGSDGGIGTVIGFSLTGATLDAGSYHLTTIALSSLNTATICLENGVIADPTGESLPVIVGDCIDYPPVGISIGEVTSDGLEIILDNPVSVAGFQFDISFDSSIIQLVGTSGGSAADAGFQVSSGSDGDLGTVIGFSLTGSTLDAGNGVLTLLAFDGFGESELCLSNAVIADPVGQPLSVQYGDCVTADFNKPEVHILSPEDGSVFAVEDNDVIVEVEGLNLADGDHFHADLDGENAGMHYDTVFSIGSVELGVAHELVVTVANADHVEYENEEATDSVSFTMLLFGDVNYDGIRNVLDVVTIVQDILPTGVPLDDTQMVAADVNGDGIINVLDVVTILNTYIFG